MRTRHIRTTQRGFTLIEMIAVVAIVGVLASAAQPMLALAARRHKEAELRADLRALRSAIDAYHQAVLSKRITPIPSSLEGYPPTLNALVEGVPDAQHPGHKLYFLRRLPRDPFADSQGPAALAWGLRSYDSPPDAPQPGADVFDVYSLTEGAGLDGQPYREW
jgi:general secretion pathway protein G